LVHITSIIERWNDTSAGRRGASPLNSEVARPVFRAIYPVCAGFDSRSRRMWPGAVAASSDTRLAEPLSVSNDMSYTT